MAKRIFSNLILNSKVQKCNTNFPVLYKQVHTQIPPQAKIPLKEVKIQLPHGHIAGKLWGEGDKQPILALHGWQDNAGTWDPLIPLILKDRPILAIDFPGHGLSSWIPPGMQYYPWDLPRLILQIKEHFRWEKIALLSHSMGAIAATRFACVYSDDVEFHIAVDSLVLDDYDLNLVIDKYPTLLKKGLLAQTRLNEEPPSYTLDEVTRLWHLGTHKSVSIESVKYLAERGTKQSKLNPNKYYFSRDSRLKYSLFNPEKKIFVEALVRRLKCPTLYLKAIDSPYSSDTHSVAMREIIAKNNDKYEFHLLPGKHHFHLNNPEVVAPVINSFLEKYKVTN